MPMVKLSSAQPLAFGKNSLLQKKYETRLNILDQNRKESQRKLDSLTEQCVASAYSLLLEAEEYEKEKLDKGTRRAQQFSKDRVTSAPNLERTTSKSSLKVRPMTSAGRGTQSLQTNKEKRPSTAQPNLGIRFSLINSEQMEPIIQENDTSDDGADTGYSTARFTESSSTSVPLKTDQSESQKRDSNEQTRLLSQLSKPFGKSRKTKIDTLSPVLASTPRPVPSPRKASERCSVVSDSARPRTADDFRKKIRETELDAYWNKRVRNLIKKWDFEDKRVRFRYDADFLSDEENDVQILSPELEMPNPFTKSIETEAALKTQKFMHQFGSKFRSVAVRPSTAPASEISKPRRRPVKVTRQEITTIKADISRRKKQTNAILRKSKRIKNHIQSLVEWKHER